MMQTTLRSMNDASQRFCLRSLTPDSFAITSVKTPAKSCVNYDALWLTLIADEVHAICDIGIFGVGSIRPENRAKTYHNHAMSAFQAR